MPDNSLALRPVDAIREILATVEEVNMDLHPTSHDVCNGHRKQLLSALTEVRRLALMVRL